MDGPLIPHLFRTEYRKIVSVLCRLFGIGHVEIAEDIASDVFLLAAETWGQKGIPDNPVAWLYAVAKNQTRDYLRRDTLFHKKIARVLNEPSSVPEIDIDLSGENIRDSQLRMLFAVCHPCIPKEAQVGLALSVLCGFGTEEIAEAFLCGRDVIYKRLSRAKEKLKLENIPVALPTPAEIDARLETVLTAMYLLFNEGYYSTSQNVPLRKELCVEAMRLTVQLTENEQTDKPEVDALLSLMCFHSSRFDARLNMDGELVLYEDQDTDLWNQELIWRGLQYLNRAARGERMSKYHLEAGIAYWYTQKQDTQEKWASILDLYDRLLAREKAPVAALNRIYSLSRVRGKTAAISEAEALGYEGNHLYHALLAELYKDIDRMKALKHLHQAMACAKTDPEKKLIAKKIRSGGSAPA